MSTKAWLLVLAWVLSLYRGNAFQDATQYVTEITDDQESLEKNSIKSQKRTQLKTRTEDTPFLSKKVQSITEIIDDNSDQKDKYEVQTHSNNSIKKHVKKEKSYKVLSSFDKVVTKSNNVKLYTAKSKHVHPKNFLRKHKHVLRMPKIDETNRVSDSNALQRDNVDPHLLLQNLHMSKVVGTVPYEVNHWLPVKDNIKLYQNVEENDLTKSFSNKALLKNTSVERGQDMEVKDNSAGNMTMSKFEAMALVPLKDEIKDIESEIQKEKAKMLNPSLDLNKPAIKKASSNVKSLKIDNKSNVKNRKQMVHDTIKININNDWPEARRSNSSPINDILNSEILNLLQQFNRTEPKVTWSSGKLLPPPNDDLTKTPNPNHYLPKILTSDDNLTKISTSKDELTNILTPNLTNLTKIIGPTPNNNLKMIPTPNDDLTKILIHNDNLTEIPTIYDGLPNIPTASLDMAEAMSPFPNKDLTNITTPKNDLTKIFDATQNNSLTKLPTSNDDLPKPIIGPTQNNDLTKIPTTNDFLTKIPPSSHDLKIPSPIHDLNLPPRLPPNDKFAKMPLISQNLNKISSPNHRLTKISTDNHLLKKIYSSNKGLNIPSINHNLNILPINHDLKILPLESFSAKNKDIAQNLHIESDKLPEWSPWSTCSATCGINGLQIRTRKCDHAHQRHLCNENAVDWKLCAKMATCPDSPHRILPNQVKHDKYGASPDEFDFRHQWGHWSTCTKKCNRRNLRVRRRFCPGQRSIETGVCLKPTMQWSWCKSKSCDSIPPQHSKFHSTSYFPLQTPRNTSKIVIQTDKGLLPESNCNTSPWGKWSKCSRTCGENSLKFRTRSCVCNKKIGCDKPMIEWQHCTLNACPGEKNYSPWSSFSKCSKSCGGGWRKRIRHCIRKKGLCDQDLLMGIRVCNVKECPKKNQILGVRKVSFPSTFGDPEIACGFLPCEEFGCLDNPYSKCQADSKCDPMFIDRYGNVDHHCTTWQRYFIKKPVMFCGYDPCLMTPCYTEFGKCAVDLKCRPVIVGVGGALIDCRLINNYFRRLFYNQSRRH